jgi:hypothetical protein
MADVLRLVDQTGHRDRSFRAAQATRQQESAAQCCDSLTDVAVFSEVAPPSQAHDSSEVKLVLLRSLVKEIAAVTADVGATSQDVGMRSICFKLALRCQHTATELGRWGLWHESP